MSFIFTLDLASFGQVLTRGAAGPLIKFFKQNGCIVIHKCGCLSCATAAHTSVLGGQTEALNPHFSRQVPQLGTQRQGQAYNVTLLVGADPYAYLHLGRREDGRRRSQHRWV